MRYWLSILILFLQASCQPSQTDTRFGYEGSTCPTNAEVLAYLEGKPLPIPRRGDMLGEIRLEGIEALSVARSGIFADAGLWSTAISFVYNTGRARYNMEATVTHRVIGEQRVFYAFHVHRIARH
jgi:hypothetical protein